MLNGSYPINTNMTRFIWFLENLCILVKTNWNPGTWVLILENSVIAFGELTRKNIYQFKTRINDSANIILQTVEKYIRDSSVGKHWETSLYNF